MLKRRPMVSIGSTTVVLNIVPVIEVSLLIKLLIGPDLLDMHLALDSGPSLGIVLHQRNRITVIGVSTRKACMICGMELTLLQSLDIHLAPLHLVATVLNTHHLINRVTLVCHASELRRRHCIVGGDVYCLERFKSILDDHSVSFVRSLTLTCMHSNSFTNTLIAYGISRISALVSRRPSSRLN